MKIGSTASTGLRADPKRLVEGLKRARAAIKRWISTMPNRPTTYRPAGRPKPDAQRGTARQRGYNSRWDRRRAAWLQEQWDAQPLEIKVKLPNCLPPCVDCLAAGTITEANEIDHEIPHRGDQTLFWLESNWRARCKPCHSRKTGRGA
jgi:5-methylcytosine-specific restriction protein A